MANGPDAGGGASCVGALAAAAAAGGAAVAGAAGVGGATGAGGAVGVAAAGPRRRSRYSAAKTATSQRLSAPTSARNSASPTRGLTLPGARRRRIDDSAVRRFDDVATHVLARRQRLLVGGAQRRGFGVQAVELDAGSAELLVGRLERSDELGRLLLGGARRLQVALAGRTDALDLRVDLRLHRLQLRARRQIARMARPERRQLVSLVARQRRLVGAQLLDHRRMQRFAHAFAAGGGGGERRLDLLGSGLDLAPLAARGNQRVVGVLELLLGRDASVAQHDRVGLAIGLRASLRLFGARLQLGDARVEPRRLFGDDLIAQRRLLGEESVGEPLRQMFRLGRRSGAHLDVGDVVAFAALDRDPVAERDDHGFEARVGVARRRPPQAGQAADEQADEARTELGIVDEVLRLSDTAQNRARRKDAHLAFDQRDVGGLRHRLGVEPDRHALARVDEDRHRRGVTARRQRDIGERDRAGDRQARQQQAQPPRGDAGELADVDRRRGGAVAGVGGRRAGSPRRRSGPGSHRTR